MNEWIKYFQKCLKSSWILTPLRWSSNNHALLAWFSRFWSHSLVHCVRLNQRIQIEGGQNHPWVIFVPNSTRDCQLGRSKRKKHPDASVGYSKIMFNFQKVKNKFNFITYIGWWKWIKITLKFLRWCNQVFALMFSDFLQLISGEVVYPGLVLEVKD
jgi:hypothetical protein